MVLQSSGAISLSNIQTEFGGTNPISISEYYGAAAGVPSSGAIDFSDFYGKSSTPAPATGRGVFGGGSAPTLVNTIDYITIATTGNATDFGDLSVGRNAFAACSSSTRGVFGGGGGGPANLNLIEYITITTTGNAIDFGDLSQQSQSLDACSSSTRGVFGGGFFPLIPTSTILNVINYITIATTGNAIDFGDLTLARTTGSSCSSSTRGVFGGGATPALVNTIDYITIATTGNATDFGDLIAARDRLDACSSSTRGVFSSGATAPTTFVNTIEYITIATTGNTTDFGDITSGGKNQSSSCSSLTRGIFGGGGTPAVVNTIDYITIATTGNTTDFGDLTLSRFSLSACSDSHGGLDGGGGGGGGGTGRGVFGGGLPTNPVNIIEYITIATTGNTTDFGDLTISTGRLGSCSSSTRGLFAGGERSVANSGVNNIEYITIATTGNSLDFGDLTQSRQYLAGCSSNTRGIFGGGTDQFITQNTIDYVTIATVGNAIDFGDLISTSQLTSINSTSSPTRGIFSGLTDNNSINYVTIATAGNALDFGDLPTTNGVGGMACSSSTRGLLTQQPNTIVYITIATLGNATDFGDLTSPKYRGAACSNSTRGVFGGGIGVAPAPAINTNVMEYVTIATAGNAIDFGDLSSVRRDLAGCSDSHGGLA